MFAVIMQMVSISMFQGIFYDLFAEFKNPKNPRIQPKYFSCNACRLFFRRAVLNEANYECMLKNSCLKRTQLADIKKCKERFSISRLESFHSMERIR